MRIFLKTYALYIAWVIALIGLLCSVFFGELLHHEPCRLCWYQRICLFPLAIILGIAVYRDDSRIATYALPLALFGAFLALYQVLGTFIPSLHTRGLCGYRVNCSENIVELWGFLSFPIVSLAGFILLFFFLWIVRSVAKRNR